MPEVDPRAGHGDRELDLDARLERRTVRRTAQLQRTLWTAEATLAVDHHRQLVVAPGDPTVRPQLAQRRAEVTESVGRDRSGLTDHRHTTGTARSTQRVLVRELGILVHEQRRRHEVPRNPVGVVLAEGLQLRAGLRVEVTRLHVLGDLRVLVTRADRLRAVRVAVLEVVACCLAETGARTTGAVAEASTLVAPAAAELSALGTVPFATRTIAAATERPVAVTTRAVGVVGAIPVTTRTIRVERTIPIPTRTIWFERAIPVATRTIRVVGTIPIATRTIGVERTVAVTTRPVAATTEGTIPVTTRTIGVERAIPNTTRPVAAATEGTVTVTAGTIGVERAIPVTAGTIRVERTIPITTRTIAAATERPIPIPTRTIRVERTIPTGSTGTRRSLRGVAVAPPRRTIGTLTTIAEATTARAVARSPIATEGAVTIALGTTTPVTFTALELTGPGRPSAAAATAVVTARSAIATRGSVAVSGRASATLVVAVVPPFVVVRHRCAPRCVPELSRRLSSAVSLWLCAVPGLERPQSITNRARRRAVECTEKTEMATGLHENEGLPCEFSMEGRWPHLLTLSPAASYSPTRSPLQYHRR